MTMKRAYRVPDIGYNVLTAENLEQLHETTLEFLEQYGVCVYGEEAQEYFEGAGCEVDRETNMVRIPHNLVNDCIDSAPGEYVMYPRGKGEEVLLRNGDPCYTNFGTGTMILDPYTGERRYSTYQDVCDIARFIDAVDEVQVITSPIVATDVTEDIKDLYEAKALFCNTSKHVAHDTEGRENTRAVIRMAAAIAGGEEELRKRPILSLGCCPNSPLEIHREAGEQIIEAAKAGLPMDVLSMGLCGGTTPITLAGTLLTTNCEILTGIVLTQIINKGNPVMYGSSTTIMDMRRMTTPVGAPEHAMIGAAVAQIGSFYNIPAEAGGT